MTMHITKKICPKLLGKHLNRPFTPRTEIGIGTGGGQQFLVEDTADNWWVVDYNAEQYVKLDFPRGLSSVLIDRLSRR